MSLKTVSGILAAAVANAGTLVVNYPSGYTRGDFIPGVDHRITINGIELKQPKKFTVSFGAAAATITNLTGAAWPAGAAFILQLELPGVENGQLAVDNKTRMPRVVPLPLRYFNLGSPIATSAVALRAAAAIGAGGLIALLQNFLDVPRNLIFTSAGNDSGRTFTITSNDIYGNALTEAVTGANAGVAAGKKAHYSNITVSIDAAAAGTVSIGFGNVLGLPGFLPNAVHILKELQDGATVAAGTTVAGDQSNPTTTTGDVRGTYVPNSAPDGTKAYGLMVALFDPGYLGSDQT